ncbi:MAG: energy transducer TonB [Alteromonadaceae bacterium]|nr:energy transducer TonB [Alteromonadaceae bacterium]
MHKGALVKARLITPLQKNLLASIASIVILSSALLLFWLGHNIKQQPPEKIIIREVALVTPPPPPPPPVQQAMVETPITIQIQGSGASMQILTVEQNITLTKPDIPPMVVSQTKWQQLEIDWDAFALDQLDDLPTLLTPLKIDFPKSLSRQGVKRVLVKLEVMIDEQGQLTLINIVSNPYQELQGEIQRLIRSSRFSAPKKDNQPVRARFVWPIEIKS